MGREGWQGVREVAIWLLFFALLVPAGYVGYTIGDDREGPTRTVTVDNQGRLVGGGAARAIEPAPAFDAGELTEPPREGWLTNGGTVWNQRYSPLDQIDTGNVAQLRGVWRTNLDGSGVAAKYSQETQPIAYDGVLYVSTGQDDVFAVSVETGRTLWKYEARLDQTISTVCCGWLNRGVALGEGRVYLGRLDGVLVALDQRTGKEVWRTRVGDWRKGYTITAAPLYYDGLVVTGVSGGEFSIRGRVQAYDATTGKLVWRFHTIPGPGETGHDSWPAEGDAWKTGGAPVWQTPAVDPELGLIYFSTGNASPDLDGSRRAGDNLFAASIVALDVETGRYRWHFQQVHHDIWDYDGPSPVVLFDVEIDGRERKALGEASKTGWLYLLDRETGKPLLPIEETPVPQDEVQKTSPTQPIPSYPPFIDHRVTKEDVAEIEKIARRNLEGKRPPRVVSGNTIFTPFGKDITVIVPGPQGGTNWQPSSYSPETGLFYVCGMRSVSGYSRSGEQLPPGKQGRVAELGSVFTTTGFGAQRGVFTAIRAATGRIAWQKHWPESCYSGSVATAGGLVFVGRNDGRLQAYDAEDGRLLWSFQTGAGANTTPTVFEHQGTQYIAFAAGGNALAATPHGDELWLFSLDGQLGPAEAPGQGAGTGHAGEAGGEPDSGSGATGGAPPGKAGEAAAGAEVFAANCSGCHGLEGTGGNGGPTLAGMDDAARVRRQVRQGGGGMPAFGGSLRGQQIADVTAYVVQRVAKGS